MTKKALIIGINYYGQRCQLSGCINDAANVRDYLIEDHGFVDDNYHMVVMTDHPDNQDTLLYPTRYNMLQAIRWLVHGNGPGDSVWLSYSGHGGQTTDADGNRPTGEIDDTICPVDFASAGQIDSATLHRALMRPLHPAARLTILFDCCHSGSACELPYIYRPDAEGNVVQKAADTLKRGEQLFEEAAQMSREPWGADTFAGANTLLHGFSGFAKDLASVAETALHGGDGDGNGGPDEDGLVRVDPVDAQAKEVWLFSGCADDQTSADTSIGGVATGAMSWAFISAMRESDNAGERLSYLSLLTNTRQLLQDNYSQIPQLSCDGEFDLDQAIRVRARGGVFGVSFVFRESRLLTTHEFSQL